MRSDVEAHAGQGAIDAGEWTPQVMEQYAVALREDHVSLPIAGPNLGVGLTEPDTGCDVEQQRDHDETNRPQWLLLCSVRAPNGRI